MQPDPEEPGCYTVVIYECIEGGSGAVSAMTDAGRFRQILAKAREIMHEGEEHGCEKVCYDCLCSFYNQLHHELLDRHLVLPLFQELDSVEFVPNFDIVQFGRPDFVNKENPEEIDIKLAQDGLEYAQSMVDSDSVDILILDEMNVAIDFGLITIEQLLHLLDCAPEDMEIIITGRYAHEKLLAKADLVTEMCEVKHPFKDGIMAREGIEF